MEQQTGSLPAWYWTRGLHDAIIEDVKFVDTPQVIDGRYRVSDVSAKIRSKWAVPELKTITY